MLIFTLLAKFKYKFPKYDPSCDSDGYQELHGATLTKADYSVQDNN